MRTTVSLNDDELIAHVESLREDDETDAEAMRAAIRQSQQYAAVEQEAEQLRARVAELESQQADVERLQARLEELDADLEATESALQEVREERAELRGELNRADEQLADKDSEIERLQSTVEGQAARISELTNMASAMNQKNTELVEKGESGGLWSRLFGGD